MRSARAGAAMIDHEEREYGVSGMTCHHCELSVQEEVEDLACVEAASAQAGTGTLTVRGRALDDDAIARAVAEAGYEVVP